MSFEEDFSSQYLSILILRLKCSQQCKYLCRKPFGCLQQHLLMNACYCRSLLYTKYRLPFFKMQRYAENKLPKHSVIMCSWHSAVFIHGLHFIGSRALEEHHEHVWRKPQKLWGPSPASCTIARDRRQWGLMQAQLHPACSRGPEPSQNLYLSQPELNWKCTDMHITRILSSASFCWARTCGIWTGYFHVQLHKFYGLHI